MSEHRQMGLPLTLRHEWVDRLPIPTILQGILSLSIELANHARPVLESPEIVDSKYLIRIERITKLHLQLWHQKPVCNKERSEPRLRHRFRTARPHTTRSPALCDTRACLHNLYEAAHKSHRAIRPLSATQNRQSPGHTKTARAAGNPLPCAKTASPARRRLVQAHPPSADATAGILHSAAPSNLS